MQKCKSNIVWKLGPFKVYGDHFYLIEEVHMTIATIFAASRAFILIKICQNCKERAEIPNLTFEEVKKLTDEFPMAFAKPTLEALKNELSS
jgi:hypothetical protein